MRHRNCGAVTIAVTGDRDSQLAQIAFVDVLCVALMESDKERFSAMLTKSTQEFEEDISNRAKYPVSHE